MKGDYLFKKEVLKKAKIDIFADKSALIIEWLLIEGVKRNDFSIREIQREVSVSIGLVQKVFKSLIYEGFIESKGLRTSKKFNLKKGRDLLESWLSRYSLIDKCQMRSYRSALPRYEDKIKALKNLKNKKSLFLALHSAARENGFSNTNLESVELYIEDEKHIPKLEKALILEPAERGYDVLLINPYYRNMLVSNNYGWHSNNDSNLLVSPPLLSFLDLYNYPLRGREQAEYLMEKLNILRDLYKYSKKK